MPQHVRTGFSTLRGHELESAFELAERTGFDFVELSMTEWDAEWLQDNADAVRAMASETGTDLVVHLPFGGRTAAVGTVDDRHRDESLTQYRTCIEAASHVGTEKGVLHVETTAEAAHLAATDEQRLHLFDASSGAALYHSATGAAAEATPTPNSP